MNYYSLGWLIPSSVLVTASGWANRRQSRQPNL